MELLIAMKDRADYRRGDVINAQPDGFAHGDRVRLDNILVVRIDTALTAEELRTEVWRSEFNAEANDVIPVELLHRRRYYIDMSQVSDETVARLKSGDWEVLSANGLLRSRV